MRIYPHEPTNDTTKRFPRTLAEAFGPYSDGGLRVSDDMHTSDKIAIVSSILAAISAAIILIVF